MDFEEAVEEIFGNEPFEESIKRRIISEHKARIAAERSRTIEECMEAIRYFPGMGEALAALEALKEKP